MKDLKNLNILEKFILREDFFFWLGLIIIIIITSILSINCWGMAKNFCN